MPFVIRAFRAFPPDFRMRTNGDVSRCQRPVLVRMPFMQDPAAAVVLEVVGGRSETSSAVRAVAASPYSIVHDRLPFVISSDAALPPDGLVRTRFEVFWGRVSVSTWVPFGCDFREERGE